MFPTKKPDIDNIAKSILDALNKLAYRDDTQVVTLHMEKHYAEDPRVEVEIEEIKMDDLNFPKWNPRWQTIRNINSDNLKIRYKALRNASSNFIARKM